MGTIRAYRQNRQARFGAAPLLALLAIFLHIASPLALQLAGPATQDLLQTVICSGGEAKTVYLDAEGNPVEPAGPGTSQHDCKSCIHHCGAALASQFALMAPGWVLPAPARLAHTLVSGFTATDGHPRAPPA
ncbi:MAG: hypothetical protein RH982_10020 [Parvibaculum sp.]